jgi:hypothetical protein
MFISSSNSSPTVRVRCEEQVPMPRERLTS